MMKKLNRRRNIYDIKKRIENESCVRSLELLPSRATFFRSSSSLAAAAERTVLCFSSSVNVDAHGFRGELERLIEIVDEILHVLDAG